MTRIVEAPRRARIPASYLRPIAIAASWLGLVAVATACFFAPRPAEVQPTINDAVGFGCSMAFAGAAATGVSFGIGGRWRWALELVVVVLLVCASAALLAVYLLWYDPTVLRGRMDFWSFRRIQESAPLWGEQLAGYHAPVGLAVGMAFGAVTGLLIRLGRRRPRLATAVALVLLFGFASDPGRQIGLKLVTWSGLMLRSQFVPGSISDDQISATGMILGAVVGCTIAALAIRATRPKPAALISAPQPDRPGRAVS